MSKLRSTAALMWAAGAIFAGPAVTQASASVTVTWAISQTQVGTDNQYVYSCSAAATDPAYEITWVTWCGIGERNAMALPGPFSTTGGAETLPATDTSSFCWYVRVEPVLPFGTAETHSDCVGVPFAGPIKEGVTPYS